jgi:itaconyl-CoA hydratase
LEGWQGRISRSARSDSEVGQSPGTFVSGRDLEGKMIERKNWEDFEVGDEVRTITITVTETHVVQWAQLTMDYYPLHMDEEFAKKTIFKGRIVHGPFTFALAVGLVSCTNIFGDSIMAWLGVENMRLPIPVRIGDTLRVVASVKEKRETKKEDRGIVTFTYEVKNQRKELVMSFDYNLLMHRMGREKGDDNGF